jgi:predicted nuclease of predicted toxin-antitoxin system
MRFLFDADLPRRCAPLAQSRGHEALDVRDVGLASADDSQVAAYAKANRLCLITGDFGFADVRNYPPQQYSGLVVLCLPRNATADTILDLLDSLLAQGEVLRRLPGRLAIVEWGNVRLRPSP